MTKLSIITINFNNSFGLQKTIQSVIEQTYSDFEFIVIDGGSSDSSVDVIKQYADKIAYWESEPDKGIYHAMNKGIKKAKGEYCLFLNSGDYLVNNDVLKKLHHELNNEDIIYGNGRREIGDKTTVLVEVPAILTLDYFSSNSLFHPSTFIKRTLFDTYGLYNESNKIVSDWEFFIKTIMVNDVTVKKIPFEISVVEDGGISRSHEAKQILNDEIESVLKIYFSKYILSLLHDYKVLKHKNNLSLIKKISSKMYLKRIWKKKK